jgi:hypothetical protein
LAGERSPCKTKWLDLSNFNFIKYYLTKGGKMKKKLVGIFICMLLVVTIFPVSGILIIEEDNLYPINDGTLSGYVYDTSMNPIEGALVRVYFHGTYEDDYTDAEGYYHVMNISICKCLKDCTASKSNYKSKCVLLAIVEDSTYDFVIKSKIIDKKLSLSNNENVGIRGGYKSLIDIPSPDGNSHRCIMFCNNHKQTLDWISSIDEIGFEKAWQKNLIKLTIFFIIPGTVFWFGLNDFRESYTDLFIKLMYRDEFLDFLNTYDKINGSCMITYLWLAGLVRRPIDFKSQPDNSWIEDSWILDNSEFIPNPEIWEEPFLWYFNFPTK